MLVLKGADLVLIFRNLAEDGPIHLTILALSSKTGGKIIHKNKNKTKNKEQEKK